MRTSIFFALTLAGLVVSPVYAQDVDERQVARVCVAAIAVLMGRDPSIIETTNVADGIAYNQYRRPSDGTLWKQRCKLRGDHVLWSTVEPNGSRSEPGRWRDDPLDEEITFKTTGAEVEITLAYSDGSKTSETVPVH